MSKTIHVQIRTEVPVELMAVVHAIQNVLISHHGLMNTSLITSPTPIPVGAEAPENKTQDQAAEALRQEAERLTLAHQLADAVLDNRASMGFPAMRKSTSAVLLKVVADVLAGWVVRGRKEAPDAG